MSKKNTKYVITLDKAWSLSKRWKRTAMIWRLLDHILVMGSFASSISVVYIASEFSEAKAIIVVLSSLAALLTLMSFACNPGKYMTNYRRAFDSLNDALVSHTDTEGRLTNEEQGRKAIIEAIMQGEKYIGRTFDIETKN